MCFAGAHLFLLGPIIFLISKYRYNTLLKYHLIVNKIYLFLIPG